ncbi:MAG: Fis family transcriptional regulator, partial [Candidatus Latescibacteria bacterium]|nr:Fis family transcriptional regulator [Candidatus Latescibacterota bacterium]
KGTFRTDLYYRINVVRITIPPLKERKEDIPLLAEHFIEHFNNLHSREIERISDAALVALYSHDYPGNIRELENAIEHAFVLCRDKIIRPEHLPSQFKQKAAGDDSITGVATLDEIEKKAIIDALRRNHYNRLAASHELGIDKSTLYRKIRNYDIQLPDFDGRSHIHKE